MKILVIGAGMMGSAAAYDLFNSPGVNHILLGDIDGERARAVATSLGPTVEPLTLDTGDDARVRDAMGRVDAVIAATSYSHNVRLTKIAIESKKHFCDLGGNMDVVYEQMKMHDAAVRAGVIIMPNCGLAPGMACVIAAGAAKTFERVDEIHIRVGGLPQNPVPPLNYQLVFSAQGLINEYLEPAEVLRDGKPATVPSMTDLESLRFPAPFESLEAFNTSGGISTLIQMYPGAHSLDYKTIRYPGHCEKFKMLLDLGFASTEPVTVGTNVLTTREFFENLLRRKLPMNGPDVTLMRVEVQGLVKGARHTVAYEMVDYYDTAARLTSMMRTTAFPTSVIAQMAADGTISARGVMPPEQCVPLEPFLAALARRNISINTVQS